MWYLKLLGVNSLLGTKILGSIALYALIYSSNCKLLLFIFIIQ